MVLTKVDGENSNSGSVAKKRRIRKKKAKARNHLENLPNTTELQPDKPLKISTNKKTNVDEFIIKRIDNSCIINKKLDIEIVNSKAQNAMSSKEPNKSREDVKAAREAKKLAKQKAKNKIADPNVTKEPQSKKEDTKLSKEVAHNKLSPIKDKDEVDRALPANISKIIKVSEDIKEPVFKKQIKKSDKNEGANTNLSFKEITNKSVSETLDKIADAAKEVKELAAKIDAINIDNVDDKKNDSTKSKADLKAERRAKQEAQRAAKAAQVAKEKPVKAKLEPKGDTKPRVEKSKSRTPEKTLVKSKPQSEREIWFQHLYVEREDASQKIIGINNSNLHPAIVKLGVQLASHTIRGSNARCVALLNALKRVLKDYSLPAKTEYSRGLESYLAPCLDFLWSMRKPSSSQTNAVKYFRYQLTQLPNNVNEYDAKSTLQEAIDTYIREQIDMAGQAISLSVRKKISSGDNILTYDCSSLIERTLKEAWDAGVTFRAVVVGTERGAGQRGREMLRRLVAHGIPATYLHLTALDTVMKDINKVILGASALLVNGWVMGVAGTALICLSARAHCVPVLVCCERHKFSERVQTDAFVYNELGDPDELIDKSNDNCPLKDWRTNPNLTLLNLMYDVTPPSLVTAVVTDLAILPCSSAPVVLRFMLSEYGF